jgi:hypothetical protein
MIKVENRESAHVSSRVKDLSQVPNVASFNALLSCITPITKLKPIEGTELYEPILIRDTASLIANFGDPRIDPEKYIDLYTIMQIVGNGGTCYVAKVPSGKTGEYALSFVADPEIDKSEESPIALNAEDNGNGITHTVFKKDVNNKYLITSLSSAGSEDEDPDESDDYGNGVSTTTEFPTTSDSEEPQDDNSNVTPTQSATVEVYTSDQYTYTCTPKDDGTFTLTVTMNEAISADQLNAEVVVDPNWGSEPITLEKKSNDNARVWRSTTTTKRTYVINKINVENQSDLGYTYSWSGSDENYTLTVTFDADVNATPVITQKARMEHSVLAHSSMSDEIVIESHVIQAKPTSLKAFYLTVALKTSEGSTLESAKVKLEKTTTNKGIVNSLNSVLGAYVQFELADASTESAAEIVEDGKNSIVKAILDKYAPYNGNTRNDIQTDDLSQELDAAVVLSKPTFEVTLDNYKNTIELYADKKYVGCLMSDMVAPVSKYENGKTTVVAPSQEDRRALHYYLKQVACERKDTTVLLSAPYCEDDKNNTPFELDEVCDWVAARGKYNQLWDYGQTNTTDYAEQSFYLEMYWSWLDMSCTKIENGKAKSVHVKVAPAGLVVNNVLTSYRERGVSYPVAGDQYGTLPSSCTILKNPKTKLERDQLIQYRINPIWDTGTRGVQIYGNDTLNAGYTDLNAAHIARTLVYIRSQIDEYTETLKFLINSQILWDTWRNFVSSQILEPLVSINALASYDVAMGEDTTTRAEISDRRINGRVSVIFYQACEVFNLDFVVYSSSTTMEEALGQ